MTAQTTGTPRIQFDSGLLKLRTTPLSPAARQEHFAQRKDLSTEEQAVAAAAKAVVDAIFKQAHRAVRGAVLVAHYDAKREGNTYALDAIVRDSIRQVAEAALAGGNTQDD